MKIALTGYPRTGKSTVFNALAEKDPSEATIGYTQENNQAIIDVADRRIDDLAHQYQPKKVKYATLELLDIAGRSGTDKKLKALDDDVIHALRTCDAIGLVIRNFFDDLRGTPDPQNELNQCIDELLLADLLVVENRLEKIAGNIRRGLKTDHLLWEQSVFTKLKDALDNSQLISTIRLAADEINLIRGFQLLTSKQVIVIINSSDSIFAGNDALISQIKQRFPVIEFAGQFEWELAAISDQDERRVFMDDLGIGESARRRLIRLAYDALGYISYFTVGSDEVRAWNIYHGDNAVQAARVIHSDIARGFIRAECFTYADLQQHGSEKIVKQEGKMRLEGKDYVVQDGDILSFRFNV